MARRLSLEGKKVLAVLEQYPYANGLTRNVVQVHDIVDLVTVEAEKAGQAAAAYIKEVTKFERTFAVIAGENVGFIVPQRVRASAEACLFLRSVNILDGGLR